MQQDALAKRQRTYSRRHTCVDGHAHTQAIEKHLPPWAAPLYIPHADSAGHVVLCQLDGPLLLQQSLLHVQAVPHLHTPKEPLETLSLALEEAQTLECNQG